MSRQPPGLIDRIRQMRRASASPDASGRPGREPIPPEPADLRARIAHLEQLVQGLQDSVYREGQRHDERIAELEKRVEPAALAAALSEDARRRGL